MLLDIAVNIALGYLAIGAILWALFDRGAGARNKLSHRQESTGLQPTWHGALLINIERIVCWPATMRRSVRRMRDIEAARRHSR